MASTSGQGVRGDELRGLGRQDAVVLYTIASGALSLG